MPVDILIDAGQKGIQISTVIDYPIKTLLFESNCNIRMMVEIVSETTRYLLDKEIPYNLMISDCGKKVFLFLQVRWSSCACSVLHFIPR